MGRRRWWIGIWLVVATAAVLVWQLLQNPPRPDAAGGRRLFPVSVAAIERVEMARAGVRYQLVRAPAGWRLRGSVVDLVDTAAVRRWLADLTLVEGGPLIPGTEPRDARYGFGGPQAFELTVMMTGGRTLRLDGGDRNPVTERYYASGGGREAVFTLEPAAWERLDAFPTAVRLGTLLPRDIRERVTRVRLRQRGAERDHLFVRHQERWWLYVPEGDAARFGRLAQSYHERFSDRRTRFEGRDWLLASRRQLREMIFEVVETAVASFPTPPPGPETLRALGLEPPLRRIELSPATGDTVWIVELGDPVEEDRLWARREGVVVQTHIMALRTAELPTADLLDLGALSFHLAVADSFRIGGPDGPVLWARNEAPRASDGVWRATTPPDRRPGLRAEELDLLAKDLVVNLDRLPIVAMLEPTAAPPVVAERSFRLQVWGHRSGLSGRAELVIGPALPDVGARLGATAERPVVLVVDTRDGKILRVPGAILVSLRSLRSAYRPASD